MTIYKPNVGEKKEGSTVPPPEVVTETLLEKTKKEKPPPPPAAYLAAIAARRRRSRMITVCNILIALAVIAIGVIGGIALYEHLVEKTFKGWCGSRYFEYQEPDNYQGLRHKIVRGEFEEQVELDIAHNKYERIDVPEIQECKRATILHDFEQNLTAVVDRDHAHCLILPLNRTMVRPPMDFWDLLLKLKTGYYLPDMEVVREQFRVMTPPIHNLSPLGFHIWNECRHFDTFRLARVDEPVALSKRSADNDWCHDKFSLGGNGFKFMEIIELRGCM